MSENSSQFEEDCVFCKISQNKDPTQKTIYSDDEIFVIPDIKPHAPVHYLVIPHKHISNPKTLNKSHLNLVKKLKDIGLQVLTKEKGESALNDYRLGYHWPPLISVNHLHMHVMYPVAEMSFMCRNGIFKPGFLFITPEWLIDRLEKMPDSTNS